MGGHRKSSGQKQEQGGKTQYDFLPWNKELFFPIEFYATGKKKPLPGPNAKSLRKAVSRHVMGRDNLELLGRTGRLVGRAEMEYKLGRKE